MKTTDLVYNVGMRRLNTNLGDAVDHLPEAAVLVLDDVGWEDYEALLEDLEDRPGIRVTYNRGRLEIVTTSSEHENWKEFIIRLVHVLCEELNVSLESYGGTTWKSKKDLQGTEADTCFYSATAHRVIGKPQIDLKTDPPLMSSSRWTSLISRSANSRFTPRLACLKSGDSMSAIAASGCTSGAMNPISRPMPAVHLPSLQAAYWSAFSTKTRPKDRWPH